MTVLNTKRIDCKYFGLIVCVVAHSWILILLQQISIQASVFLEIKVSPRTWYLCICSAVQKVLKCSTPVHKVVTWWCQQKGMTFFLQVLISNQSTGDFWSLSELGRKEKMFPCADCRGRTLQDEESASHREKEQQMKIGTT